MAETDPAEYGGRYGLPIEPRSPGLERRIWWGAGTRETAENAGRMGVNLMSSTLLAEATGEAFADLQAEQIERYRAAYCAAGHSGAPRVSVSRSIFPIVTDRDRQVFSSADEGDSVGIIDGLTSTFGRTYTGSPDELVMMLKNDAAVMAADTLMLTIPSQLGVDFNLGLLSSFAEHVAPELGWKPNTEGPVQGERIL